MKLRELGNSGLKVAPLAFGGNVFGWTADETTSFRLLDAFVDAGFNLVDTADVYSRWAPGNEGGESETILGKWMKKRGSRSRVIVATKVGMEMGPGKQGLSRPYILRAVEDSLRRLQTDVIDLYQAHRDDEGTPLEETLEAFDTLIRQGKVRAIGASNYSGVRLARALEISRERGLHAFASLQPLYNLYDRKEFETELEPVCRRHGVGVINYYSLAAGFLTGKYRSSADYGKSPRGARAERYLNERGLRILDALDRVAEDRRATPAQVAIAWLVGRPSVTAPIASATSLAQLEDLIAGVRLELGPEERMLLDRASEGAA